jgi:predicted ester cyclase
MDGDEARQRLFTAVEHFNTGFGDPAARAAYLEFYAPDVKLHGYPPGVEGAAALGAFYASIWDALPDGTLEIEEVVVDGDRLSGRFRLRGTHTGGPLMGVPPQGAQIDVAGQTLIHLDDSGRAAERWQALDNLGLLTQLGAIPAPA